MKTRGLAIAVAVAAFVGFCQLVHATEIVVLIDGNRMDVKSYEIQTRVVVVTTWDGKVQSFGCNSHTDTAGSLPTAYRHDIVESRNLRLVGMCEQGPGSLEAIALHESSEG